MCGNVDIAQRKTPETGEQFPLSMTNSQKEKDIFLIADLLKKTDADLIASRTTHTFGDGIYTRTAKLNAGEIVVGVKHRIENVFHVSKGAFFVWDVFHGIRFLRAPFTEITLPGTQRFGLFIEDSQVSNILKTAAKNVGQVEAEMLFPFLIPDFAPEKIYEMICRQLEP